MRRRYIDDSLLHVVIEEGPSEEVTEATEAGDASGPGSLQLLGGSATVTSHAGAALERNALNEPIRFVQLEFDDIPKQLAGDMIDIKISSIYKFEKKKKKKKKKKKRNPFVKT